MSSILTAWKLLLFLIHTVNVWGSSVKGTSLSATSSLTFIFSPTFGSSPILNSASTPNPRHTLISSSLSRSFLTISTTANFNVSSHDYQDSSTQNKPSPSPLVTISITLPQWQSSSDRRNLSTKKTPSTNGVSSPPVISKQKILIIASAGVGLVFLISVVVIISRWNQRRVKRKRMHEKHDKYFFPPQQLGLFSDLNSSTGQDINVDDLCVSQLQLLDACADGDGKDTEIFPLSFQGINNKVFQECTANEIVLVEENVPTDVGEVESATGRCSSNEEGHGVDNVEKDGTIEVQFTGHPADNADYLPSEENVCSDTRIDELCRTDTTVEILVHSAADGYKDSLQVLRNLDQLLENESVNSAKNCEPQENKRTFSGEDSTNKNLEIKRELDNVEKDATIDVQFTGHPADNADYLPSEENVCSDTLSIDELCRTDATVEVQSAADGYKDSLQVLQNLDELLENERVNSAENLEPQENKRTFSGEDSTNKNVELKLENGEEELVVLFSFRASGMHELTLDAGATVSVMENKPSGWSWVKNEDAGTGWFPTQYLGSSNCSSLKRTKVEDIKSDEPFVLNIGGYHPSRTLKDQKHGPDFIVLHSFCASNEDELTLEKNAIVSVIENRSSGWSWIASADVGTGWFPTCYLKPLVPPPNKVKKAFEQQEEIVENMDGYLLPKEVLNGNNSNKGQKRGPDFIVLHSFCALNEDELTLDKGAVVSVIENRPSGWSWITDVDFGTGWFPTHYLKPLDCSSNTMKKIVEEQPAEDDHGYLRLAEEHVKNPVHEEDLHVYAEPDVARSILAQGDYEEYEAIVYRASHTYNSSKENELSFEENEEILVLEETESGWWRGSTYLGDGWFPSTYVEMSSSASEKCAEVTDSIRDRHLSSGSDDAYELLKDDHDDVSPYQVTDLASSKFHLESTGQCDDHGISGLVLNQGPVDVTTSPDEVKKIKKRRRPPPTPPMEAVTENNEQEVDSPEKSAEAEKKVVVLRSGGSSKIIKITNRRSMVNPAQSYIGPPPDRPVPIPPPRKNRKPTTSANKTLDTEKKPRARLQASQRTGDDKNACKDDVVPKDVPKRPPPPTPEKLKEYFDTRNRSSSSANECEKGVFTENQWSQEKPTRGASYGNDEKEDVQFKNYQQDLNANKISANTEPRGEPDINTNENYWKDLGVTPKVNTQKVIQEKKIAPKPRRRKQIPPNDNEKSELSHSQHGNDLSDHTHPSSYQNVEQLASADSVSEDKSSTVNCEAKLPVHSTTQTPVVTPKLNSSTDEPKSKNTFHESMTPVKPEVIPRERSSGEECVPARKLEAKSGIQQEATPHSSQSPPKEYFSKRKQSPNTKPEPKNPSLEQMRDPSPGVTLPGICPTFNHELKDLSTMQDEKSDESSELPSARLPEVMPGPNFPAAKCNTKKQIPTQDMHSQELDCSRSTTSQTKLEDTSSTRHTQPTVKPKPKPRSKLKTSN